MDFTAGVLINSLSKSTTIHTNIKTGNVHPIRFFELWEQGLPAEGVLYLLTREQLAVILHRYACYAGRSTETNASVSSFTDASAVSDYAKDALCWAYGIGLIQGAADGKGLSLQPKGTATRAQTAAILMRYRLSENKADTLKEFDIA